MALTLKNVLDEVQRHFLETPNQGASLSSDLWTLEEWVDAFNSAQDEFLKMTDVVVTPEDDVAFTPNNTRHDLPQGVVSIVQAQFKDASGAYTELDREEFLTLDSFDTDWEEDAASSPRFYFDGEIQQNVIGTAPRCSSPGTLNLFVVEVPSGNSRLYLDDSLADATFVVPDEFIRPIKWRAMEILLRKPGRAFDPARADYCRQRFEEGVLAARLMLEGGL